MNNAILREVYIGITYLLMVQMNTVLHEKYFLVRNIDTLGKECSEKNENMFLYKQIQPVPPLAFIDDLAA